MRFFSSSALAKAPKLRLAASCSAAETIAQLPGPPGRPTLHYSPVLGLPQRWAVKSLPTSAARLPNREPARGFRLWQPTGLLLARCRLRLHGCGLLGGRLLALGLVGGQHLLLDQRQ